MNILTSILSQYGNFDDDGMLKKNILMGGCMLCTHTIINLCVMVIVRGCCVINQCMNARALSRVCVLLLCHEYV